MTDLLIAPPSRFASFDLDQIDDHTLIAAALARLDARVRRTSIIDSPDVAKAYFALHLGQYDHEVFAVAFLDSQHGVIAMREMFHGTLSETAVYPREILRVALLLNAAALMVAHCHPSGSPEPSRADERLTARLKEVLATVDVRLLDHFVVGGGTTVSFAERGLL